MSKLRVITAEAQGDKVIETLEEALALAKAGDLSSVALAMVHRDGTTSFSYSELPSRGTMVGSVTRLQHYLIQGFED